MSSTYGTMPSMGGVASAPVHSPAIRSPSAPHGDDEVWALTRPTFRTSIQLVSLMYAVKATSIAVDWYTLLKIRYSYLH